LTALNFGKTNNFYSNKLVSETITNITFYNSKGIEKVKNITQFNNQNRVTVELRYDENGNLKQRLTRMYDSTGTRSITRKFENWHPLLGHTVEITSHEYDINGFLTKVIDKNQNSIIIRQTNIINNEKGYPIELSDLVRNEILGKETAEYDYDKNEVTIKYFNKLGELINSQNTKIESSKGQPEDILNEYGDIIQSAKYKVEIKYDKFGNWVKKSFFNILRGKLIKSSEERRTIKYIK
jgi:YD repeat-containing protein